MNTFPTSIRSYVLVLATIIAASTITTACSESKNHNTTTQQVVETDVQSTDNNLQETRIITDAIGRKVEIPLKPKKILALSELDLDSCLALGFKPYGVLNGRGQSSPPVYLQHHLENTQVLGNLYQPNLDLILMADADLILMGGYASEGILNQLQAIAPTVSTYRSGDNWKQAFSNIASYLQKDEAFNTFISSYQQDIQNFQQRYRNTENIPDLNKAEVSVVRWNPKGPSYMYKNTFALQVLQDMGFSIPTHQEHKEEGAHSPSLSLEALELIDADWLFMGTLDTSGEAFDLMQQVSNMPAFQHLEAFKKQRFKLVDGSLWTSIGGPLAAKQVIQDIQTVVFKTQ